MSPKTCSVLLAWDVAIGEAMELIVSALPADEPAFDTDSEEGHSMTDLFGGSTLGSRPGFGYFLALDSRGRWISLHTMVPPLGVELSLVITWCVWTCSKVDRCDPQNYVTLASWC